LGGFNVVVVVVVVFFFFSFLVQSLPLPLPKPKMVINSFGNQKYMQPMGRLKHALKVP
jgi:hypothetical protein